MEHQKQALTWLTWRESQKPSGGILADDMDLGLTMISRMLTSKLHEDEDDSLNEKKYKGGILLVCPAYLLTQWEQEVMKHSEAKYKSYHGNNRPVTLKRIAKYDVVLTSYDILRVEYKILNINWQRVVLDHAHKIKNHKSPTAEAVCGLKAKTRWAVTQTPIVNNNFDIYAILKFLRCSPLDDLDFKAALRILTEQILPTNDKAIIASEWTEALELFSTSLTKMNVKFEVIARSTPSKKRREIIEKINCSSNDTRILLLSLKVEGVGLNFVGANHLLLLDFNWNQQLERQVQDRMCRVGQKKQVHIYKFMIIDSIEQTIKHRQDRKLELAAEVEDATNIGKLYALNGRN